jgi:hypothetical protein
MGWVYFLLGIKTIYFFGVWGFKKPGARDSDDLKKLGQAVLASVAFAKSKTFRATSAPLRTRFLNHQNPPPPQFKFKTPIILNYFILYY